MAVTDSMDFHSHVVIIGGPAFWWGRRSHYRPTPTTHLRSSLAEWPERLTVCACPRLDTDERHEAVRASGTYLKKS